MQDCDDCQQGNHKYDKYDKPAHQKGSEAKSLNNLADSLSGGELPNAFHTEQN